MAPLKKFRPREMSTESVRRLDPIEMAALIAATVDAWKFVNSPALFSSEQDAPSLCDVAIELYGAISGIPSAQGLPQAHLLNTEPQQLEPIALAAAIAGTVEIWSQSRNNFVGSPATSVVEAATQLRAAIDVLTALSKTQLLARNESQSMANLFGGFSMQESQGVDVETILRESHRSTPLNNGE